jgi:hypothetical protein
MSKPKKRLPSDKAIGRELEEKGLVAYGKDAYNQTGSDCMAIAQYVAERFGYEMPSRQDIEDAIYLRKNSRLFGNKTVVDKYTEACLVVRTTDNPNDVHLAFQLHGKEYNFGPAKKEGFTTEMVLPLKKKRTQDNR